MISAFGDVLLRIGVLSDALEALYGDGREWSLFSGEGLAVDAQGTTCILPDEERARA